MSEFISRVKVATLVVDCLVLPLAKAGVDVLTHDLEILLCGLRGPDVGRKNVLGVSLLCLRPVHMLLLSPTIESIL